MRPSAARRIEALERRMRARSPRSSAAREYLSGLLKRLAAARQAGGVGEELEAELAAVRAFLERRLHGSRGEGRR